MGDEPSAKQKWEEKQIKSCHGIVGESQCHIVYLVSRDEPCSGASAPETEPEKRDTAAKGHPHRRIRGPLGGLGASRGLEGTQRKMCGDGNGY